MPKTTLLAMKVAFLPLPNKLNAMDFYMQNERNEPSKWYRQFWPWFLIALPGTVVIASISTLVIAITHGDNLVRDDYYKDGLAINRYLEQDEAARLMQLSATGKLAQGYIEITLRGTTLPSYKHLLLRWQHPTSEDRDFKTVLINNGANHYSGQLPQDVSGRWYLALESFDNKDSRWRLKSHFDTDHTQQFTLGELSDDQSSRSEAK
ncbi:MAG: FixH family protein [Zhongshania sp.]|uniref:FixH family protein n=1 Tax=Zhongshania sp. TaxID=1971902 RepID=UPI00261439E2|nr:FixH family protein [Zhongshania sp.]MDF1691698.1 FixH family protein [Zhongshania sp.]